MHVHIYIYIYISPISQGGIAILKIIHWVSFCFIRFQKHYILETKNEKSWKHKFWKRKFLEALFPGSANSRSIIFVPPICASVICASRYFWKHKNSASWKHKNSVLCAGHVHNICTKEHYFSRISPKITRLATNCASKARFALPERRSANLPHIRQICASGTLKLRAT